MHTCTLLFPLGRRGAFPLSARTPLVTQAPLVIGTHSRRKTHRLQSHACTKCVRVATQDGEFTCCAMPCWWFVWLFENRIMFTFCAAMICVEVLRSQSVKRGNKSARVAMIRCLCSILLWFSKGMLVGSVRQRKKRAKARSGRRYASEQAAGDCCVTDGRDL